MSHIFNSDSDTFRAEQIGDDDQGLSGDLSEEDILDLYREKKHEPHLGVDYRNPQYHYLNEAPNDLLSPYKLKGENLPELNHHNSHRAHVNQH